MELAFLRYLPHCCPCLLVRWRHLTTWRTSCRTSFVDFLFSLVSWLWWRLQIRPAVDPRSNTFPFFSFYRLDLAVMMSKRSKMILPSELDMPIEPDYKMLTSHSVNWIPLFTSLTIFFLKASAISRWHCPKAKKIKKLFWNFGERIQRILITPLACFRSPRKIERDW